MSHESAQTVEHRRTSRSGLLSPAQSTMLVVPLVLTIVHGWYWIVDRLMYFEFTLSGKKKFLPREGRCECSDDQ
ncbi:Hypothetical protein NTJ_16086 [Nesidiocoris tenuis]|uniref:Uncharacterized protein n=1 Tax=Nesidiocoris tenuis TaxID=355587 RepID=A0ABN7BFZ8_9HEMI|nr:Hypothetical protein NTJ_16086 [Nesidiocoris tenuis]